MKMIASKYSWKSMVNHCRATCATAVPRSIMRFFAYEWPREFCFPAPSFPVHPYVGDMRPGAVSAYIESVDLWRQRVVQFLEHHCEQHIETETGLSPEAQQFLKNFLLEDWHARGQAEAHAVIPDSGQCRPAMV